MRNPAGAYKGGVGGCVCSSTQKATQASRNERMTSITLIAVITIYLSLLETGESLGDWRSQDIPRNCEEWRMRGALDNTHYLIDPDQNGPVAPFEVLCDMKTTPASDVLEHNYSQRTEVVKAPHPKGLTFNVTNQNVSTKQIETLMAISAHCSQHLKYDCHGSIISSGGKMTAHWYSRDGRQMSYWPGGPPSGQGCACGINRSCAGGKTHFCNCDKNDNVWRSDEGTVTDMNALPITQLVFTDTEDNGERGIFTLGPLTCQQQPTDKQILFDGSCGNKTRGNQELLVLSVDSSRGKQCMGWSGLDYNNNATNYHLSFLMMADMTAADGAGNPGLVFNMRDQHNYDLVFFRLHSTKDCYEYGYVEDGRYHNVLTGRCVNIRRLSYHKWFQVKVEVRKSSAKLYLNKEFLVEINTHHPSLPRGGVLALNGNNFFVLAMDFKLSFDNGRKQARLLQITTVLE